MAVHQIRIKYNHNNFMKKLFTGYLYCENPLLESGENIEHISISESALLTIALVSQPACKCLPRHSSYLMGKAVFLSRNKWDKLILKHGQKAVKKAIRPHAVQFGNNWMQECPTGCQNWTRQTVSTISRLLIWLRYDDSLYNTLSLGKGVSSFLQQHLYTQHCLS